MPSYQNTMVDHPELGRVAVWKVIAWEVAKSHNHMVARADGVGLPRAEGHPPSMVGDDDDRVAHALDLIERLTERLDALEAKRAEQAQKAAANEALTLAESLASANPRGLMASLPDSARRVH